jgi:hypothetical protein
MDLTYELIPCNANRRVDIRHLGFNNSIDIFVPSFSEWKKPYEPNIFAVVFSSGKIKIYDFDNVLTPEKIQIMLSELDPTQTK